MKKILCITCNPKEKSKSTSQLVAGVFLDEYRKNHPDDVITEINLFHYDIARIDADVLNAWESIKKNKGMEQLSETQKNKINKIHQNADYFSSFDKYIFVTPMWNLSFPAELKMYLDSVCVVGKTFSYTPNGAIGLLSDKDKKCLCIHSNGGLHYGKVEDHSIPYLISIMRFMGVDNYSSIVIEGVDAQPGNAHRYIEMAANKACSMAITF